ncbi:unnamed protein product [Anisakis simplex]|uniref:Transmembrane protein n=1 Tax=Anisakis simplex TaxID=6269 RepID=A0A0M3KHE2_ANISI|nr:unnamed protein product [Anisakis simplex]
MSKKWEPLKDAPKRRKGYANDKPNAKNYNLDCLHTDIAFILDEVERSASDLVETVRRGVQDDLNIVSLLSSFARKAEIYPMAMLGAGVVSMMVYVSSAPFDWEQIRDSYYSRHTTL